MAHMRRLTYLERQIIEICLSNGKSHRAIGRILGRDHRVISREVKRNKLETRAYNAKLAQELANCREESRCKSKLEKNEPLRKFVIERLLEDLSPEQIAGLLKYEPPEHLENKTICHESIYQYIYKEKDIHPGLYKHLRHSRKRRRHRGVRKHRKAQIQERISIHDRPSIIDNKQRYGDFECDLVEGPRSDKQALAVHYERKSQSVRLHRVKDKTALESHEALLLTIELLPKDFVKSITFDNGPETAMHYILRYEQGIDTFHCDPYCSWQKGGVENINGLVRQYIPKGAKLSEYSDKQIKEIETKLNNRPRKQLNYKTPNQVLAMAGVGH